MLGGDRAADFRIASRDEIADEFWLVAFDLISERIILKNPAKVINHGFHEG
jgi:hypothetical protein